MSTINRRTRRRGPVAKRRPFMRRLILESLEDRTLLAGEPILVVTAPANPFSSYYTEILRAEGLNAFATSDIAAVSPATLANHDIVILGEMALTSLQVTMFSNWVSAGGNLIAMRPDKQLAGLLGLTDAAATRANAYLQVNTTSGPGVGIVNETIQYHGSADLYTLNGASSVATLYSNATTATPNPAVTLRNVGDLGGQAAAFTYDLARSVVYTRQGNPAWSGQDRDGLAPIRSNDLFYGNASFDPQPDWVDVNKIHIPQADEQQRLLANLALHMNLDNFPLPRFWYLPRGERAAVVMTGDDHSHGGTGPRFNQYIAASPPGSSAADWSAVRSTSYIYVGTPDLSDAQIAAYVAQGFEVALHVNTNAQNWTPAQLDAFYADQLAQFRAAYPSAPAPVTNRTHAIVWSDYVTQPKVELKYGIRFDTNYYHYGPLTWIQNRPGHMTGSAMPMRFADVDGTLIDVYQAHTQMTDESGQNYPFTVNALLDAALDARGYYGVFTANMHTDSPSSAGSDAIIASAQARSVPVVSSRQMLTWLDGRNASSFGALSWDPTLNALRFTITPGVGANGLEAMVPLNSAAGQLTSVTRDGLAVTYAVQVIKGVSYAFFSGTAGAYESRYGPDTTPPTVTATSPSSGASQVSPSATVRATFSEPVQPGTVSFVLKDAANATVAATVSYDPSTNTATLTPNSPLAFSASYTATVSSAQDLAGNTMTAPVTWSFTTMAHVTNATIWPSSTVPANPSANDPAPYELGVKFRSDITGYITGLRFYKGAGNTGTHVGHLWTATGTLLGTATFTSESASGWQQADFAQPIQIQANTTYVASYFAPAGHYAFNGGFFASSGVDSGVLHALSNGAAGGNGVFREGTSGFPTSSFNSTNYWVDLVFSSTVAPDTTPPTVTATSPASGAAGVPRSTTVTATFSEPVQGGTISFVLKDASNNTVPATVSYNANVATLRPNANLAFSTTYTATVSGAQDLAGNSMAAPVTWSFTTTASPPAISNATIWTATATPAVASANDPAPYELGVKFRSDIDGFVTGVRFYKGPANTGTHLGHLWTATGTLLGSVTFTTETASGWQQADFAQPLAIQANTVYVVSYFAPNGNYAFNGQYFASGGVDSGVLHALSDAAAGGNGVFRSGTSGFPNSSFNAGNYWVDVVFSNTLTPPGNPPTAVNDSYTTAEDSQLTVAAPGVLGNDSVAAGATLTAVLITGPSHGTLTLNANGSFTYTPAANYSGPDSFTYRANDGSLDSNVATVSFTVTAVNDAPVAANDSYSASANTVRTVAAPGVLGNDTDADGNAITAALVTGPSHGTVTLNADGSFTYTPAANYAGPDSFTYRASDGSLASAVATVSLTVSSSLAANDDAYATAEDSALTVAAPGLLGNDTAAPGATLTAALVTGPAHGTVTLNANGSFTYTPAANYNGPDSFTYRANDGQANSNTGTVSLTVTAVNDAPVAASNSYSTSANTALTVTAPGVLGNDTDVEGNALTAVLVASTGNGTLTLNADGSFTYTPAAGFNGVDSFSYKANDGSLDSNIATVAITITGNAAPVANNDAYSTAEDSSLTVVAPGVLGSDTDADGNSLTAVLVAGPVHGTLILNANGSFTYTPAANYSGPDSFTYKANDGALDSNVATVTITISPVNDAPAAANDTYSTAEDTPLTVAAPGLLGNDSDVDGDALTAVLVSGPSKGTLTLNANGSFTYTPNANANGPDSFTYKARDAALDSNVVTVSLTVTAVNDAPVAANNSYSIAEDTVMIIAASGVLGNDTDVDGDALTAVLVAGPANGTLTLNSNGSFTYTPNVNYNGSDSFTYKTRDGALDSNVATVTLTVTAVNDAPVAVNDSYTTAEDTLLAPPVPGVRANDSDVEGDPLTALLLDGPFHGTLTWNGTFVYTPAANYHGPDSFTYRVSDGQALSNVGTVSITVTPVNDAPVAVTNSYSTPEEMTLNTAAPGLLGNDTDVEGDTLTAVLVSGPAHGTLTLNSNGSFSYAPAATYSGPDSFTYQARDSVGAVSSAVAVTLTVTKPTLTISNVSANEGNLLQMPTFTFTVTLSSPTSRSIAVNYATANGTATEGLGLLGGDYNAASGTLTFSGGQVSKTINVTVNGDLTVEPNETFFVNLSNASTPLADGQGLGTIVNDDGGMLHLAGEEIVGTSEAALTDEALAPVVTEAAARWAAEGMDTAALNAVEVRIVDLPGTALGASSLGVIYIDVNAAGHGWFVDPTPGDDSEFVLPGDQGEQGRVDLLTVVAHEMGHALGLEHSDGGVMEEELAPGVRHPLGCGCPACAAAVSALTAAAPAADVATAATFTAPTAGSVPADRPHVAADHRTALALGDIDWLAGDDREIFRRGLTTNAVRSTAPATASSDPWHGAGIWPSFGRNKGAGDSFADPPADGAAARFLTALADTTDGPDFGLELRLPAFAADDPGFWWAIRLPVS